MSGSRRTRCENRTFAGCSTGGPFSETETEPPEPTEPSTVSDRSSPDLELLEYAGSPGELRDDGPQFVQIGDDGRLLSEPVPIDGRLEVGSSRRADVVVDFSDYAGETLLLHNDAP